MVDREAMEERLARLDYELGVIDGIVADGRDPYLADTSRQHVGERALQVSIQICIDVGAHFVAALGLGAPGDYADVFERLSRGADLDRQLAEALKDAAKQRNILVHLYLDVDSQKVWEGLENVSMLRDFARWAYERARESGD